MDFEREPIDVIMCICYRSGFGCLRPFLSVKRSMLTVVRLRERGKSRGLEGL